MTPDKLKNQVVEVFDTASLLNCLELDTSYFRELPRLFETAHLFMRITLNNQSAIASASTIAAKLKRELQQRGIELEYAIVAQWKVAKIDPSAVQCCDDGNWMLAGAFDVELQSGCAKRTVAIRVTQDAKREIRRYLRQAPASDHPNVIQHLLNTWLNQQLECGGTDHWDPVLYPVRSLRAQDVAALSWRDCRQPELQPQLI
jgi:hypothetical protein